MMNVDYNKGLVKTRGSRDGDTSCPSRSHFRLISILPNLEQKDGDTAEFAKIYKVSKPSKDGNPSSTAGNHALLVVEFWRCHL